MKQAFFCLKCIDIKLLLCYNYNIILIMFAVSKKVIYPNTVAFLNSGRSELMINVAICDDNSVFLNHFKSMVERALEKYTADYKVSSFSNGNILLSRHMENEFNIIFLDIDMPNLSGFDIAKKLRDLLSKCFIVFITNHSELVYESLDFQPFNFIRKNCNIPIEESTEKVIQKMIRHMRQNEKIILEDEVSGRISVRLNDIIYIESDKHYVIYHISGRGNAVRMRDNISDIETDYSAYDFIRIHKRYIVNLHFVSNIDSSNNEIILGSVHTKLPLSRNYKKNADEKYTLFLRSIV